MGSLLFVPTIIFLVVVAPIWLVLHYWSKRQMHKGLSGEDRAVLEDALQLADRLEERVLTLERILDAEHKGWRDGHGGSHTQSTGATREERL